EGFLCPASIPVASNECSACHPPGLDLRMRSQRTGKYMKSERDARKNGVAVHDSRRLEIGNWKFDLPAVLRPALQAGIRVRDEQTEIRNWKLAQNLNLFCPISSFKFRF
ncbi:MAG: hypothetical protein KKD76_02590, partial [Verrucomicrobia bacterium]|nr:hypothetical protein [Verrucomicrobiota bacterium]